MQPEGHTSLSEPYGIIKRQRYLSRLDCHNLDSGDESNPKSMLNVTSHHTLVQQTPPIQGH